MTLGTFPSAQPLLTLTARTTADAFLAGTFSEGKEGR